MNGCLLFGVESDSAETNWECHRWFNPCTAPSVWSKIIVVVCDSTQQLYKALASVSSSPFIHDTSRPKVCSLDRCVVFFAVETRQHFIKLLATHTMNFQWPAVISLHYSRSYSVQYHDPDLHSENKDTNMILRRHCEKEWKNRCLLSWPYRHKFKFFKATFPPWWRSAVSP